MEPTNMVWFAKNTKMESSTLDQLQCRLCIADVCVDEYGHDGAESMRY